MAEELIDVIERELSDVLGDYTDECGEWPPIGALAQRIEQAVLKLAPGIADIVGKREWVPMEDENGEVWAWKWV